MPQCQRSPNKTRLDLLLQTAPGTWTCPGLSYGAVGCPGSETYRLVTDEPHVSAALEVIAATAKEFSLTPPTRPVLFIWGEYPQHIEWEGKSEIYLGRGAFGNDLFFWQAAHEAFHHVCTPPAALLWSHELLATLWAFKYLVAIEKTDCATASIQQELAQMEQCPLELMLSLNSLPYPTGFYGRAAFVGSRLEAAVGWERLKSLARFLDGAGRPDVEAWRDTLPATSAAEVREILAPAAASSCGATRGEGAFSRGLDEQRKQAGSED